MPSVIAFDMFESDVYITNLQYTKYGITAQNGQTFLILSGNNQGGVGLHLISNKSI